MKQHLELLIKVQVIDTNIQQSEALQNKFHEDIARLENEEKSEEDKFNNEQEELNNLEKEHRRMEGSLEDTLGQKVKFEDRLLSIKTNKEYQAALQEKETIKKSIQKQEDALLEVMEKIDFFKKSIKKSEKNLKTNKAMYSQQKEKLESDLQKYLQQIAEQQEDKNTLSQKIDPKILKDYQNIKDVRQGLAVVAANNELCAGCNMKIPPQFYNEILMSDKIITCPNCCRMLYIKPD